MLVAYFADVKLDKNANIRRNNTRRKVLNFSIIDQEKWNKFTIETNKLYHSKSLIFINDLPPTVQI